MPLRILWSDRQWQNWDFAKSYFSPLKEAFMGWFFLFFFLSGLCSILYEIVWLRLSMAQFGVTSALVSIVLSMFMAGLGLGSWGSGRLIRKHGDQLRIPALRLYALIELLIGVSALIVPRELLWGRAILEHAGLSSSGAYYLVSGAWIGLALVPWCACMGATIPVAMLAIRQGFAGDSQRSFSYLYLANVVGAAAGSIAPLFLIELYGFHGTLKIGAGLNAILAGMAIALSLRLSAKTKAAGSPGAVVATTLPASSRDRRALLLLFATGLTSMALELVWIRQFTPYLGTMVYAFASILGLYLTSTFIGSQIYRRWGKTRKQEGQLLWVLVGLFAILPVLAVDPRIQSLPFLQVSIWPLLRLAIGIVPFSAALGFITPMLVDRWSGGDPDRAGSAYAVNVVGCILGPLLSGFLLLPWISERWVSCLFALPWLLIGCWPGWSSDREAAGPVGPAQNQLSYVVALAAVVLIFISHGFEDQFQHRQVRRDNTATIIATGEGMNKRLLVNGMGITSLTPITKMMAHLPLAFLDRPPQNALTICFGMGTTYRSLLSWGIPSTAVELVPSVPRMFGYYHPDGPALLQSPLSHVVIDDGRRYLERTTDQFDVITIDPPPPVEAAGSSMLYSKEFYSIIKQRLRTDGILQQWLPAGDLQVRSAVARALKESFPYVRVLQYGPSWGFHFLASSRPIPNRTGAELVERMPAAAIEDMMEWKYEATPEQEFTYLLQRETSTDQLIAGDPLSPAMQDDRPVNEYFLLRGLRSPTPAINAVARR
jgi:spermidine synthase